MVHEHPHRARILQVQPQPHNISAQAAVAPLPEVPVELKRGGLLRPVLRDERGGGVVGARRGEALAGRVVGADTVCPCLEGSADGGGALRDDVFACTAQFVVDALRVG